MKSNNRAITGLDEKLKLIVKSAVVVFFGLGLSKILAYIYRILIARIFGPEVYGAFSISIMIVGLFCAFSSFGLVEGLLKYVSFYNGKKDTSRIQQIIRFSLTFSIISSVVSALLMFSLSNFIATVFFHDASLAYFFKLFSIAVPFSVIVQLLLSIIRAFEKIGWYSFILNIVQNISRVLSLVILILIWHNSGSVAVSYLISIFAMLVVSFYVCKKELSKFFLKPLKTAQKTNNILISYSWPLLFSSLVMLLFGWIDTFSVAYYYGTKSAGIYNAALPIAMLLSFVPFLFVQLFFPVINKEYAKNNLETIRQLSKQIGKWIFIINLPILLIFTLFPGVIINLLFGADYLGAELSLIILSFGFFFMAQAELSLHLINTVGKSKLSFIDILLASLLNIILNITFIPIYGISGAALATSISYLFYSGLLMLQANKYFQVFPLKKEMFLILISGIISTFFIFFIRANFQINLINMVIAGIIFAVVYLVIILLVKGLDKTDIMIISSIKNKVISSKKNLHSFILSKEE